MRSVDARAKNVNITITGKNISCTDDGDGFATKEDVLRYFGRFGTPHAEGDATYGRFRLGRGQIMAYGRLSATQLLPDSSVLKNIFCGVLKVNSAVSFLKGMMFSCPS